MNPEDRLRRASQEIDRVTASLSVPPIGEVRRASRMRTAGVVVAAAVGAIVLVGGAVLALNPGGEATIAPAGPGETTTTTTATTAGSPLSAPDLAELVRVADFDLEPNLEVGDGQNADLDAIAESDLATDLALLERLDDPVEFTEVTEVLVLGQTAGLRSYVIRGTWEGNGTDSQQASRPGECLVWVRDGIATVSVCTGSDETGWHQGSDDLTLSGLDVTLASGRAPEGTSVVIVRSGSAEVWQRTRERYWILTVSNPDHGPVDWVALSGDGALLTEPPDQTPVTIAPADPDCSAGAISPSALALSSVTQPVAQTLNEIVEAAQACDFDVLEAVGGDTLTASFGGGDASELWTFEEKNGYKPMYWLLSVLDLPYATIDLGDELMYIWPRAAAHDAGWDTMPEEYIDELRAIYTDDDFEDFSQFGGYIGYRVGITESGDWSFFVAGD